MWVPYAKTSYQYCLARQIFISSLLLGQLIQRFQRITQAFAILEEQYFHLSQFTPYSPTEEEYPPF